MNKPTKRFLIALIIIAIIGVSYYSINPQHLTTEKLNNNTGLLVLTSSIAFWGLRFLHNEFIRLKANNTSFYRFFLYLLFLSGIIIFFVIIVFLGGPDSLRGSHADPWYYK